MDSSSQTFDPNPPEDRTLPDRLPVMVLTDCHLFPGCLLPLYIFEERYRLMLTHVLSTNRMFCVGSRESTEEGSPVQPYTTAGLVRACVKQSDGTSQLLLLGLRRIRLTGWVQEKPFKVATIEPVATLPEDLDRARELKRQVLELFANACIEEAKQLRAALEGTHDPELVCDVLSYHFTRCPKLQQKLLAEVSLIKRYEMLLAALQKKKCN
ncbi:LON peptidase substrate-binding domain-containing protein [Roseimicrobium sp. ORNL1]|jgi:Lon protease-like protein|uniref:LON peptidase substrate-binding domain-containing protein n=1 Tax=Roseimicrobium sp. ORNL1 TaxID=2711231 RepID=UPI0013E1347F|nr:LON peptidase substrate-binding domain-containing protein [Roseimicrobium sp. ORNL1]QIF01369.1 hypothetical protein G5S37_07490 [Roseimicrobium sp. ORNL1]